MSRTERLVFGIFLVMLGSFMTLGNLGKIDAVAAVRNAWPAVLLLWGALVLVRSRSKEAQ